MVRIPRRSLTLMNAIDPQLAPPVGQNLSTHKRRSPPLGYLFLTVLIRCTTCGDTYGELLPTQPYYRKVESKITGKKNTF